MGNQLVTIPVPGTSKPIKAVQHDDTEWAAARHICDALGISWATQSRKLKDKAWATVVNLNTVGADGKNRDMAMVDRRTLTMWLATINPAAVSDLTRPTLEAYQLEAASALDSYFHKGGALSLIHI